MKHEIITIGDDIISLLRETLHTIIRQTVKIPFIAFKNDTIISYLKEELNSIKIMPVQSKLDKSQIQFFALEQLVESDSIVRIVDLFCQYIDYNSLSFVVKGKSHEGKPALEASTLTAIYIYGY